MNQENIKLEKVKKSCGAVRKVAIILTIILIVGCVAAAFSSVFIFSMGSEFDEVVMEAEEKGVINNSKNSFSLIKIDDGFKVDNIETDSAWLQEKLDAAPLSIAYGIYCITIAVTLAVLAVCMSIISKSFKIIEEEESPFTDKVIKRMTVTLIVISVLLACTANTGFGILMGFITWAVYTILDYGKVLQIQSDETM